MDGGKEWRKDRWHGRRKLRNIIMGRGVIEQGMGVGRDVILDQWEVFTCTILVYGKSSIKFEFISRRHFHI